MEKLVVFYWHTWYCNHMDKEIWKNLKSIEHDLRRRLRQIEEEEGILNQDLQSIKRMLARYEGQIDINFRGITIIPSSASTSVGAGDPKVVITKTLKQHVLDVLRDISPRPLRAGQIRREVTKRGYISEAKSFEGAMFAMLSNLWKMNHIRKVGPGLYTATEME